MSPVAEPTFQFSRLLTSLLRQLAEMCENSIISVVKSDFPTMLVQVACCWWCGAFGHDASMAQFARLGLLVGSVVKWFTCVLVLNITIST